MDFNFTDEEKSVSELARKILTDLVSNERLKKHESDGKTCRHTSQTEGQNLREKLQHDLPVRSARGIRGRLLPGRLERRDRA